MTPAEKHAGMKAAIKARLAKGKKHPPKKDAAEERAEGKSDSPAEDRAEKSPPPQIQNGAALDPKNEIAEAQLIAAEKGRLR